MINNGHRDFVYASRSKSLKLRYLVRLYAKELVMHNFVGLPADQLLERTFAADGGASQGKQDLQGRQRIRLRPAYDRT